MVVIGRRSRGQYAGRDDVVGNRAIDRGSLPGRVDGQTTTSCCDRPGSSLGASGVVVVLVAGDWRSVMRGGRMVADTLAVEPGVDRDRQDGAVCRGGLSVYVNR